MKSHDIIVSVLRKHLISRKVAEQIATEVDTAIQAEYDRQVQEDSKPIDGQEVEDGIVWY
jgi:hypothetical protein